MTDQKSGMKLRQLLAALSRKGAYLSPLNELEDQQPVWATEGAGKPVRFSASTVKSAVQHDYLDERQQGGYLLSATGRAAYRRLLSHGTDAFSAQHRDLAVKTLDRPGSSQRAQVTVNLKESPLAWLASRKDRKGQPLLDEVQLKAGERLRSDFTFASMTPSLSNGWRTERIEGCSGGAGNLSTDVLNARKRVYRVLDGLPDALSRLVVDVCCHLKGLEDVEHERGWPARSAKVVLQIALTSLAQEYGEITQAPGRRESR